MGTYIPGTLGLLPMMIFYIGVSIILGTYLIIVIIYYGPKRLSRKPDEDLPFKIIDKQA